MKKFFCWYDNGSGWFEAHPDYFPVEAESAEEALRLVGGPSSGWGPQVVTGSADADPNVRGTKILAQ